MEQKIEQPVKEIPAKKRRGSLLKGVLTVGVCVGMLVTVGVLTEASLQQNKNLDHLAKEVKINPEIKLLTDYQKARNSRLPVEIAELQAVLILDVAEAEGLPVELVVGIAEKETLFNPMSLSPAGATGLVQILHAPGITIEESKRFDIKYGLEIGCKILHGKLEKNKGDLTEALSDYSGNAAGYSAGVYESIGRYVMYKSRQANEALASLD